MDLIDEQQLPGLQIHQQANDVARPFQGGRTGDAAAHPQLLGQHHGHGGLAKTWWSVEQHVIKRIAAAQRRFNGDPQHLLELPLTDVILKSFRSQPIVTTGTKGWILIISRLTGCIHHARGSLRP